MFLLFAPQSKHRISSKQKKLNPIILRKNLKLHTIYENLK